MYAGSVFWVFSKNIGCEKNERACRDENRVTGATAGCQQTQSRSHLSHAAALLAMSFASV